MCVCTIAVFSVNDEKLTHSKNQIQINESHLFADKQ